MLEVFVFKTQLMQEEDRFPREKRWQEEADCWGLGETYQGQIDSTLDKGLLREISNVCVWNGADVPG